MLKRLLILGIPRINLRLWRESHQSPQQLSALNSILPDFSYSLPTNNLQSQVDEDFEQYLESKTYAEQKATAPTKEEILEIPVPLSRDNYLHAYDNEPDSLFLDDLIKDSASQPQGRSNVEFNTDNTLLEELFKSAREEAFEDKELFY